MFHRNWEILQPNLQVSGVCHLPPAELWQCTVPFILHVTSTASGYGFMTIRLLTLNRTKKSACGFNKPKYLLSTLPFPMEPVFHGEKLVPSKHKERAPYTPKFQNFKRPSYRGVLETDIPEVLIWRAE